MKKILLIGFMFWSFGSMAQTDKNGNITSVSDGRLRVGGGNESPILFVDVSNDRLGVGDVKFNGKLSVNGSIRLSDIIHYFNDDSAKMRVSGVILKGREADCVADIIRMNPSDFPILDSVIKALYIVKPANGDDVTFNSVPNKEWMRIFKRVKNDPVLIIKNAFKNIMDELLLHGGSFIIHRINLEVVQSDDEFNAKKKSGQDYAQKKDDGAY